jgi:prepilin-type N-terminal cleavage/methylation domain-containing protein
MGLPPALARRGFTLLEMIVAIGIVLILLSIAVIGFRSLDASASKKETNATLTSLQGMMAELEATAGITRLVGDGGVYGRNEKIIRDPNPPQVHNPGDVVAGTATGDTGRYGIAVRRTQEVINRLMQVPKNKTAIGQLGGKRLLGKPTNTYANANDKVVLNPNGGHLPTTPVLLDGWRNPILFVPSAGMEGVDLGLRSDGTHELNDQTIIAPGNRPFWASAGPDGDFTKGDDNVYSFGK